ncbi:MAG: hypothetical protein F9K31_07505 [Dokdonella sp.]|nr:MAG: hypothetical protein F9K31_07505 [Dokdonella sp.]
MKQPTSGRRARHALAAAIACALVVPCGAQARDTAKEQQLEARIQQLEAELAAIRDEIRAQRHAVDQVAQQQAALPPPPPPAPKEEPKAPVFSTAKGISVALHGFINATAFSQDHSFAFGNGQNAQYVVSGAKGTLSGFDIRNTRFWLDFTGAQFNESWGGGGRIEMDFFGGFNGTGPYSFQQPTPRLRQAYLDIANAGSGTRVRIGQQWDLMFPVDNLAASVTHVGFPLGFGTGFVGWRFPGVVVMQDLGSSGDTKWRMDVGAFSGSWNGPGANTNFLTGGNVDFQPQLQARIRATGSNWVAYVVGHYSKIDLKGVDGTVSTPVKSSVDSTGLEIGGQWKPGNWTLKGLLYTGNGLGQIFGNLSQFGDIGDTGGYVQVGYNFTKNWSLNGYYGTSKSDREDVVAWLDNGAVGRLRSRQSALSVIYASGPYQLGLEWLHDQLDTLNAGAVRKTSGNQVSVSAQYTF